jgi:sugar phosphate isomerase/epimerase
MAQISRRRLLVGVGVAAACAALPAFGLADSSTFKVGVISDEIAPDFDHACFVIAKEFGLHWVELRSMWGKNLQELSDDQLAESEKILAKYGLRVTDIGSPLFKIDWPGAPRSSFSPKHDSFGAEAMFKQQDEVLERSLAHAKRYKTNIVRCFDFFRLEDVKPYRAEMNRKLLEAANVCGKQGVRLALENEFECNTANPEAWKLLPKERIFHCHVKNAIKNADGKIGWSPVDKGYIDWAAQFRALSEAGYRGAVSLETHWSGAATHEESTRISWAGMKKDLHEAGVL